MQGGRSINSGDRERSSRYPQNAVARETSGIGMVYNVKCGRCGDELSPYPLGQPPADMLEVNVAPARNISYNHGLNRRVSVCGKCAESVLRLLGITNFDYGER